ncbi:hypothetical protein FRB90_012064 [Tulasnella sp. 427]|nr:hypothetical protein FRB90_012064 [Tulasnella sp. 427]
MEDVWLIDCFFPDDNEIFNDFILDFQNHNLLNAKKALAKMSNEDKVAVCTGVMWLKGHCVGNTPAVSSINFPGFCLQDGPLGVRLTNGTSVFPAGINTAASWNRQFFRQRGAAMGAEFRAKGVNVALAPDMNLMRVAAAGRNWETFGADPFLTGEAAYETVTGLQSTGVQACAKHYINNEQEAYRGSESSVVDDRTEHELYLHPFLKSVQASVASVMCSYNRVNGTSSCENSHTLKDILKGELGFQGYVMTDWWVDQPSGPLAANDGLDMVMPGDDTYASGVSNFGPRLIAAVNNGTVPQSRLDDMATRILASWYLLGQDSGYPSENVGSQDNVDPQGHHKKLIRQIGAASIVLLKNTNKSLPLKKPSTIAVIGSDAGPNPSGPNSCPDRACNIGILAVGWGSGTAEFPYLVDPLSAIKARAPSATISSSLNDFDTTTAANTAKGKDVALVFISSDSGEGYLTVDGNAGDRNNLTAWHNGDALVSAVAAANTKTIVVVNSVGPIIMEPWISNPNVVAVVWAGLLGQEAGNAITDILFGDVNPSGRLPYTIAKQASDYGAAVQTAGGTINYSEGVYIDYRWFDKQGIAPRYEFGFGLSYTTFGYSKLSIKGPSSTRGSAPTGPGSSLSSWLHQPWVTVTFRVTNTGSVSGTEIPQLYIKAPASANSPPNQLRGFDNVSLKAGASSTVTVTLSRYSFSVWSTTAQQWQIPSGKYTIWVGSSSRKQRLSGTLTL